MAGISAVPAPKGLELGFVDKAGSPLEEARYGLFDQGFVGTTLTDGPALSSFVTRDARSFRLRLKTPLGAGKKQLKATWRTLWPMKPDELTEADAGGPLDGKMIHQSDLTLTLAPGKEKGVYLSEPVMLVASKADLVPANVGWKDAVASEGQPEYRLLLAHLQGHVQLEHAWGKGKLVRRSIPVWKKVRTLWVQNLVCQPFDDASPGLRFDPRGGDDKEFFCHSMRSMQQVYAVQGLYVNSWQPGPDVHVVQDGGTAYSFRFAGIPRRKTPQAAGDPPHFPKAFQHEQSFDPLSMTEWARCVRYAREFPAWSPNAIRIFFGWQSGARERSFFGTATGDSAEYAKEKPTVENASLVPARRSVFIMHGKGLTTDPSRAFKVGATLYGPGPYTTAHEVGHVLAPKGPDTGGVQAHALGSSVFLMVEGGTDGTLPKSLGHDGTKRIFDEPDGGYKWLDRMQTFSGLEG